MSPQAKKRTVETPDACPRTAGSALIVVLWTIILLSMLVAALTFDARVESRVTSYYRKRLKAEYLMRSGFPLAELLIRRSKKITPYTDAQPEDEDDRWFEPAKQLIEGHAVTFEQELGEGKIHLRIEPVEARRNVNKLKEDDWEGVLEVCNVPEEYWPVLIDSVLDWIDKDNMARADGAESDYYEQLDPPYRCKNGPLDTVDELMLVKGFTRAIVKGGILNPDAPKEDQIYVKGLDTLLTPFGSDKVDVNAASRDVLMTLSGRLEDNIDLIADAILEERAGLRTPDGEQKPEPFRNIGDLLSRVPDAAVIRNKVAFSAPRYYRISSTGILGNIRKTVQTVARFDGNKLTILRWREEP